MYYEKEIEFFLCADATANGSTGSYDVCNGCRCLPRRLAERRIRSSHKWLDCINWFPLRYCGDFGCHRIVRLLLALHSQREPKQRAHRRECQLAPTHWYRTADYHSVRSLFHFVGR